jgi:DNA repair protein RadC
MRPQKTYEIPQVGLYMKDKIEVYNRPTLKAPRDIFNLFSQIDKINKTVDYKETAYAIYLNIKLKVLSICLISEGSDLNTVISPKQIAQGAILQNAYGVILVHNHPSEDVNPSDEDRCITHRINECLKLFDIKLLDHIIITSDNFLSFTEEDLLC